MRYPAVPNARYVPCARFWVPHTGTCQAPSTAPRATYSRRPVTLLETREIPVDVRRHREAAQRTRHW